MKVDPLIPTKLLVFRDNNRITFLARMSYDVVHGNDAHVQPEGIRLEMRNHRPRLPHKFVGQLLRGMRFSVEFTDLSRIRFQWEFIAHEFDVIWK